jgi:hypothetical protein
MYLGAALCAQVDVFLGDVLAHAVRESGLALVLGVVDVLLEERERECALGLGAGGLVLDVDLSRIVRVLAALLHDARYARARAQDKRRVDVALGLVARAVHVVVQHGLRHPPVTLCGDPSR